MADKAFASCHQLVMCTPTPRASSRFRRREPSAAVDRNLASVTLTVHAHQSEIVQLRGDDSKAYPGWVFVPLSERVATSARKLQRGARAGRARDGGCRPARTTVRISGRSVKRRSDNRCSTVCATAATRLDRPRESPVAGTSTARKASISWRAYAEASALTALEIFIRGKRALRTIGPADRWSPPPIGAREPRGVQYNARISAAVKLITKALQ
ncbi:hypothetical protein EVAR_52112_1 [Eumeta japonica]|uniref:Uncharacterized protein n=1 Tax=Eumeta variegata TaxID=151549 RepID=A0A4C1XPB9_EUMVA|nr:hypothetical protein EVAR_52112_1 [Eumeta japonica]